MTTGDMEAAAWPGRGPAQAETGLSFTYDGRAGPVARIAIENSLLSLLTLGFYRFWGKTRLRRYVWSRVRFGGERLEYTGLGKELLIGFLVALVVILPLFVVNGLAEHFLAPESLLLSIEQIVYALTIWFLILFAIYRARRYRLSRTLWRGIRFAQGGSAVTYAGMSIGWQVLVLLSLGVIYPVYRTRMQEYRTENTWFGQKAMKFDAPVGPLFGPWLIAWLLLLPSLGTTYIWYRVCEFNHFAAHTRLAGLAFAAQLRTGRMLWIVTAYFLSLILAFFVVMTIGGFVFASEFAQMVQGLQQDPETMPDITARQGFAVVALIVVYLLIAGVLRLVVLFQPMVRAVSECLDVRGAIDFDAVAQSDRQAPKRGEGLFDLLDAGEI